MTDPIILVTRDSDGFNKVIGFCETEQRFYIDGVAVELRFAEESNGWWGTCCRPSSRDIAREAVKVMTVLARNPWADVSPLFTHSLAEPGAPLEPVHGSAA